MSIEEENRKNMGKEKPVKAGPNPADGGNIGQWKGAVVRLVRDILEAWGLGLVRRNRQGRKGRKGGLMN